MGLDISYFLLTLVKSPVVGLDMSNVYYFYKSMCGDIHLLLK